MSFTMQGHHYHAPILIPFELPERLHDKFPLNFCLSFAIDTNERGRMSIMDIDMQGKHQSNIIECQRQRLIYVLHHVIRRTF